MEYIRCDKWHDLADQDLDFKNKKNLSIPSESSVIHFHTEYADYVLDALERTYKVDPSLRFILVSSTSDCGICYQKDNPASDDLIKAFYMIDTSKLGYEGAKVDGRCHKARCNLNHRFSVKMYAFTYCTFDRIPPNVIKWYTTNNDTQEDKIQSLPFGIPYWFEETAKDHFITTFTELPNARTYLAFQANTMERYQLINSFSTSEAALVRRAEVPHVQYLQDMLSCGFVLSPSGNGIDCFRTLESLYVGRIPIIPAKLKTCYTGLPVKISGVNHEVDYEGFCLEGTIADKAFWRAEILKQRELL